MIYYLYIGLKKIYIIISLFITVAYFGNCPIVCGDDKQLSVEMTKLNYP